MTRKRLIENTSEYHRILEAKFQVRLVDIKAFIRAYWEQEHHSPSIQDIRAEFNTSTSVVARWLKRLEKDGWIEPRKPEVARNIVPVEIFANRPVFPDGLYEFKGIEDFVPTFKTVIDIATGEDHGTEVLVEKMTDGRIAIVQAKKVEKP